MASACALLIVYHNISADQSNKLQHWIKNACQMKKLAFVFIPGYKSDFKNLITLYQDVRW